VRLLSQQTDGESREQPLSKILHMRSELVLRVTVLTWCSALGQNFSKMFGITVEDPDKKGNHLHVWQNSWYVKMMPLRYELKFH
jgi:hypothetical protein